MLTRLIANIESLCYTFETNIMLYANYTSIIIILKYLNLCCLEVNHFQYKTGYKEMMEKTFHINTNYN